jgi:hypothetical protein
VRGRGRLIGLARLGYGIRTVRWQVILSGAARAPLLGRKRNVSVEAVASSA